MLTTIASFLITRGVPMRWTKPLIYVVLAVLLIAAALLAKHLYDNHVIEQHEAERAAIVERSDRQIGRATCEGKGVSVRGSLGGCRCIKNKTKEEEQYDKR